MTVSTIAPDTGGIPVASAGAPAGSLVVRPGQLQYGDTLLGGGTAAGWRNLYGWRNLPEAQLGDSTRPQAHGSYPGSVFGDSLLVTFTYLLRGLPEQRAAAVDTIERATPLDGVERALVVDDGAGPWLRWARVVARDVPQDVHYSHAPLECSVQFLCADPRRYALAEQSGQVRLAASSGGLEYAAGLVYPLGYGESSSGSTTATNSGTVPTPLVATFQGPLTDPVLTASDWQLGFNLELAEGETLVVDTSEGTALLNGYADRLYTLRNDTSPIELCVLRPGVTNLTLTAPAGTGQLTITYRDARM